MAGLGELALAGITTIVAANPFIREVDLPVHNARFAVSAAEPASAFVVVAEALWRDVLFAWTADAILDKVTRGTQKLASVD